MVKMEINGWMSVGITPMHSFATVYPKLCSPNSNPLKKSFGHVLKKLETLNGVRGTHE
jgi:hypothetical protein